MNIEYRFTSWTITTKRELYRFGHNGKLLLFPIVAKLYMHDNQFISVSMLYEDYKMLMNRGLTSFIFENRHDDWVLKSYEFM